MFLTLEELLATFFSLNKQFLVKHIFWVSEDATLKHIALFSVGYRSVTIYKETQSTGGLRVGYPPVPLVIFIWDSRHFSLLVVTPLYPFIF